MNNLTTPANDAHPDAVADLAFLRQGGEMGQRMRAADWAATDMGAARTWPQSLRTALSICLNSPALGAVLWGPELRMFYNDAYIESLADRHPAALGRPVAQVWDSAWEAVAPPFYRALASGEGFVQERVVIPMIRRGKPEITWWTFTAAPILGEDGSIVGLFNQGFEITSQVLAERAVAAESVRQRHALQQMPGFVGILAGPQHVYTYVNDAYVEVGGARDYLGRDVRSVFPELIGQGFFEQLDQVYRSGESFSALSLPIRLGGNDSIRYIDILYHAIRDENSAVSGIFVGGYEVTQQVRTVQQLRESESRFRQLAENIADVFWIFAPEAPELLYVSPAYASLWGGDADVLRADPMAWLAAVHPLDHARVAAAFAGLREHVAYDEEFRIVSPVDGEHWIRDRGYAVSDENGTFYRMIRISQDITVRKMAEQKLLDADRLKDEFLATLAHELRNPLGPIQNSVDLLRIPGGVAPAIAEKSVAMIARQTQHLVRLVDDLLDVSRITQGKVSMRAEPVELQSFIGAAVDMATPFLNSRGHSLTVATGPEPIWMIGDTVRLSQIVANLLHNAGKYTPQGGVIALNAQRIGPVVQIRISDNGIGIAPEKIEHIFDLFAQAGHASDRAQDGLGIGLSLVRELTLLHAGTVYASSDGIGMGSCFTVQLPIAPAPALAPSPVPAAEQGNAG